MVIWGAGSTGKQLYDGLLDHDLNVQAFLEVHPRRIGGTKRGVPIFHFEEANRFDNALILIAVGVASARAEIRKFLIESGRFEGRDFLFVA